jgi:DnaJ-domain-containing protein 1
MSDEQGKGWREKLSERAKAVANRVQEGVTEFEDKGGWRGAFERVRVKGEAKLRDLNAVLEQRGIHVGKLLPLDAEEEDSLRAHYKTLGVAFDADMPTVKAAYRELMRANHPDRHAQDPEQERIATEKTRKISVAYDAVEQYLRGRG